MKNILIDTNGLISFVVDRDKRQNQLMYDLLSGKENVNLILISNVISEFVYVMDKVYKIELAEVSRMVRDLLKMPNLDFVEGNFPEIIFTLWPNKVKDFGDAVIAAASLTTKFPIYTFDKKLSRQLKSIKCSHRLLS